MNSVAGLRSTRAGRGVAAGWTVSSVDYFISFAARVFESDLGGLVTKHSNIDLTQLFIIVYRVELAVEASNTYLARSKGLLR